ncbi:DUF1648 domain-containing protein [Natronomonas marina]|jgi:uncharacterized membrane protein|uniref:DUF1648 domain-containing protein n=1 Tax=Natronomonas marina TaxID=2961939 RepID=UPI0020C98E4B|nr:DUF1648 domain-containing protein [Natronomonas marina]
MALDSRWPDVLAAGLLAASALAGLALWPRLPAEMAIHFDSGGDPDDFVARPLGVALAPALGVAGIAIARLSARADPSTDARVLGAAVLFVGAVVAYVQALVLAYNLGYAVPFSLGLTPVLVAAALLTVYALRVDGPL